MANVLSLLSSFPGKWPLPCPAWPVECWVHGVHIQWRPFIFSSIKLNYLFFLNSFICTVCSFLHQRVWLDLRHFLKILMTVYNKEYISIKNTNQPLLVFIPGTFYPRKQEAVRKTTPELLSAVLRSLLCGCVCVHFTSILCTLYSRVGQFFRF